MHLQSDLALPKRTLLITRAAELMSRDALTASQQLLPAVKKRLQPAEGLANLEAPTLLSPSMQPLNCAQRLDARQIKLLSYLNQPLNEGPEP